MDEESNAAGGLEYLRTAEVDQSKNHTTPALITEANTLLRAALGYAAKGRAIIPLQPQGKVPLTEHGLKDASTDTSVIRGWWKEWPHANIGILTGTQSGCFVLDVDGETGEQSLRALEATHGLLSPTVEIITGRGRHLYFRHPETGAIRNSAGKLGDGLDVRGSGGYVVAPPSVHTSGRCYVRSVDSADTMSPAPLWLLSLLQETPHTPHNSQQVSDWPELLKGVGEGQRNDSLARLAGLLFASGLPPHTAAELCLSWNEARCKPPLPHQEAYQIINSIAGRELTKRKGQ